MSEIRTPGQLGSNSVGYKPRRLLAEGAKSEIWAKEMADWCIASSNITYDSPLNPLYNLYNGKRDTDQFDYITKTFGVEFPAKIKHIPLIRPKLNRLVGEEEERVLEYDLVAVDDGAVAHRKDEMFAIALRKYIEFSRDEISEEEFMQTETFLKRTFKTNIEVGAHKALEGYIHNHRLHEKFSDGFKDKLITGQEYYRVHANRVGEDPLFEVVNPGDLYFSPNIVDWVSECDWVVRLKQMSSGEIIDSYGDRMTEVERTKLTNQRDIYAKSTLKVQSQEDMDKVLDTRNVDPDNYANYDSDLYDVYEVEFKSIRKVNVLKQPRSYDAENPFVKILSDEEVTALPKGRKKNVEFRYMEDLWRVVRIGTEIYPVVGKVIHPERNARQPSKVQLSYEGMTFARKIKPFSLVKVTWDLQMLYDIMHFHKENLIAMSGTRGAIMDISKMPDFGFGFDQEEGFMKNMQMWLYYKKMGAMFIDSSNEKTNPNFNQLGSFDDTLGQGLGVVLEVIRHLEETAGEVISVNRQRLGQGVTPRDGQKANADAVDQSSLATEPIYNEHDNVKERIMMKILNVGKVAWQKGKNGAYLNTKNMEQEMFTLDPGFSLHDYNLFLTNKYQSRRRLDELKQMAIQLSIQGQVDSSTAIDIMLSTSLREVDQKLREDIKTREMALSQQQQQLAEIEQQEKMAKVQSEQQKLQLEAQKIQAEIQAKQHELSIKERELENTIDIDRQEILLDRQRVDLERLQLELSPKAAEVRND
jgi:hypothetical protein